MAKDDKELELLFANIATLQTLVARLSFINMELSYLLKIDKNRHNTEKITCKSQCDALILETGRS